jgi:cytochrome c biogenesis protein
MAAVPAIEIADMPGATGGLVVVQMPEGRNSAPYLLLDGVDEGPLVLAPGDEATTADVYTYRFLGRTDGAGINVKRDPGDTFIFIAVVLALGGLAMTFYVPRRRLWAKVSQGRVQLAGIAERTTRFDRELRRIGVELGASDARPDEGEERW